MSNWDEPLLNAASGNDEDVQSGYHLYEPSLNQGSDSPTAAQTHDNIGTTATAPPVVQQAVDSVSPRRETARQASPRQERSADVTSVAMTAPVGDERTSLNAEQVLESDDMFDNGMLDGQLLELQRVSNGSCSGRALPPIGDIYFQNVRSRGVIVMAFVFAFLTAEGVALNDEPFWVCFLLLMLVPSLCATFPGTGAGWLAVGWVAMSAYHGLFVNALFQLKSSTENYYVIGYMSFYMGLHQIFYLQMIADVVCNGYEGVGRGLQDLTYAAKLFPVGGARPPTVQEIRIATAADYDPLFPSRYSKLRLWTDSVIDLPFVAVPQRKLWNLPSSVSQVLPPLRLPLPYIVAQMSTLSIMISFGRIMLRHSTDGSTPAPQTASSSTSDAVSGVASALARTEIRIAAAVGLAICLLSMHILTVQVRRAVRSVHYGQSLQHMTLATPWRSHNYIGIQAFTNMALLLICFGVALFAQIFTWRDFYHRFGAYVIGTLSASWLGQFLQRIAFARFLSDKTSIRHHRLAVVLGHVVTLISIVGGPGAVIERVVFFLTDFFVTFARPLQPVALSFPFLDHLYRSLWSLIYLNNDCANPVKQAACAVFLAEVELQRLRKMLASEPCGGVPAVMLSSIASDVYLPHVRHAVRALVLKQIMNSDLAVVESVLVAKRPERIIVPLDVLKLHQPSAIARRRVVFRWRLAALLLRLPSLASLRKTVLWETTFAVPPLRIERLEHIAALHRAD